MTCKKHLPKGWYCFTWRRNHTKLYHQIPLTHTCTLVLIVILMQNVHLKGHKMYGSKILWCQLSLLNEFFFTPGNQVPVVKVKAWSESVLDRLRYLLSSPQRSWNGIHNPRRVSENSECKESLWVLW